MTLVIDTLTTAHNGESPLFVDSYFSVKHGGWGNSIAGAPKSSR